MKRIKELVLVLAICAVAGTWIDQRSPVKEAGFEFPSLVAQLPPTDKSVLLVELDPGHRMGEWARQEIEAVTGVKTRAVRVEMPAAAWVPERQQFDAELIMEQLSQLERKPNEVVIAVTSRDLFTSAQPAWRYCFGSHGAHASVLSSARMGRLSFGGSPSELVGQVRLRKMLLRYTLEQVFELPRNDDPESLLYNRVMGPADLDRMQLRL